MPTIEQVRKIPQPIRRAQGPARRQQPQRTQRDAQRRVLQVGDEWDFSAIEVDVSAADGNADGAAVHPFDRCFTKGNFSEL
jgi:hypothetical protein